jgi:hypothetical protein
MTTIRFIEPSGRDETLLAILTPVVWARQMYGRKHLAGPSKVQTPFLQSLVTLGPVKGGSTPYLL